MKTCPYCAEDIQDAAIVCKHCGRDLAKLAPPTQVPSAIPTKAQSKKTSPLAWGCLSVIVLFLFMGWCASNLPTVPSSSPSRATAAPPAPAAPATPLLALLSARGYDEYGYYIVEGQVKNISDRPLKNVEAKASWFDKSDAFIKSSDALIDFNPILPGQTSAFKTMTSGNPAMTRFNVEFVELMGGSILTDDQRKKK